MTTFPALNRCWEELPLNLCLQIQPLHRALLAGHLAPPSDPSLVWWHLQLTWKSYSLLLRRRHWEERKWAGCTEQWPPTPTLSSANLHCSSWGKGARSEGCGGLARMYELGSTVLLAGCSYRMFRPAWSLYLAAAFCILRTNLECPVKAQPR